MSTTLTTPVRTGGRWLIAAAVDARALELVEDDGRGRAGAVDGIGTASMRERAVQIGGDVHIGACGPGTGVRL